MEIIISENKEILTYRPKGFDSPYVNMSDMARIARPNSDPDQTIQNFLRTRDTLIVFDEWEQENNEDYNPFGFEGIVEKAGDNMFSMSPSKWISETGAIGLRVKRGCKGGVFIHYELANTFAIWLDPRFQLVIAKKIEELLLWYQFRDDTRDSYKIQMDAVHDYLIPITNLPTDKHYIVYASVANQVYRVVLGMTASEWREDNPDFVLRDRVTWNTLSILKSLETLNAMLIQMGYTYEERTEQLIQLRDKMKEQHAKRDERKAKQLEKKGKKRTLESGK